MSGLVFSQALVLSPAQVEPHWPIILWDNHVSFGNVAASSASSSHPVTELANSATHLYWLSLSTAEQLVTVTLNTTDTINAVGIARHNLGSASISVAVEVLSADVGAIWETVLEDTTLGTDDPALLVFEEQLGLAGLRLRLKPNGVAPSIAVLSVGQGFWVQHGLKPSFTPIVDGMMVEKINGLSEAGESLGDPVVKRVALSTSARFSNVDRDWYRNVMRPFIQAANRGRRFFFAALPTWYPREVGFCWFPDGYAARPSMDTAGGHTSIELQMNGIAS